MPESLEPPSGLVGTNHPDRLVLQTEIFTWEDWITRVDRGKAMKDYKYKNDYAGILSWIDKEEKEETQKAFDELMAEAEYLNPHYGIYQ